MPLSGFSDNWANQRLESFLPLIVLRRPLCFAVLSRRRDNFSVAQFSWSWSEKMANTKKIWTLKWLAEGKKRQRGGPTASACNIPMGLNESDDLSVSYSTTKSVNIAVTAFSSGSSITVVSRRVRSVKNWRRAREGSREGERREVKRLRENVSILGNFVVFSSWYFLRVF